VFSGTANAVGHHQGTVRGEQRVGASERHTHRVALTGLPSMRSRFSSLSSRQPGRRRCARSPRARRGAGAALRSSWAAPGRRRDLASPTSLTALMKGLD
jgi:hypothetical protein